MTNAAPYRYDRFDRRQIAANMKFRRGPHPGEPLPSFELETIEGERFNTNEVIGKRPLLITMASITCPMTTSSTPILKRLYRDYQSMMDFLTLYVREAHPGERYPQPRTLTEKRLHGKVYRLRDEIPWTIAVDSIEGEFHQALGGYPNATYIINEAGTINCRLHWSNHERALRQAIERTLAGEIGEKSTRLVPMLAGIGSMQETLQRSGESAKQDMLWHAPPAYLLGQVAGMFKPLSPTARGVAAVVCTVAAGLLAGLLINRDQIREFTLSAHKDKPRLTPLT